MEDVSRILAAVEQGDRHAAEELLPAVYEELRQLAARRLAQERPGQSLQATALVHEAYLRLTATDDSRPWDGRRHFFAAAAEAMRRILVEHARRRQSLKRGGEFRRRSLDEARLSTPCSPEELLDLDDALGRLAKIDPEAAELVELRSFSGVTQNEAAEMLGMPRRSADRLWAYAKAFLRRELDGRSPTRNVPEFRDSGAPRPRFSR